MDILSLQHTTENKMKRVKDRAWTVFYTLSFNFSVAFVKQLQPISTLIESTASN